MVVLQICLAFFYSSFQPVSRAYMAHPSFSKFEKLGILLKYCRFCIFWWSKFTETRTKWIGKCIFVWKRAADRLPGLSIFERLGWTISCAKSFVFSFEIFLPIFVLIPFLFFKWMISFFVDFDIVFLYSSFDSWNKVPRFLTYSACHY